MWNRAQIIHHRWLPVSSFRSKPATRMLTTLLGLATLSGVAAVAVAAVRQTDTKAGPALTNSAKPIPPKQSEPVRETVAANPIWAPPIEVLAATRDRPLFSPTRRPPPPPVFTLAAANPAPARPPEPERPPLLLIGTVASETTAIAVFLDQKTSRTVRLRGGQSHDGWVLGAVYKKEVVLQKDRVIAYLPLSAAAAAPAAATQVAEARRERRQR